MKLLDKLKDLFIDEVDVPEGEDMELEEVDNKVYQEPPKDVLPKVMRETIEKEEKIELKKFNDEPKKPILRTEIKKEEVKEEKKFSIPFDFEKDFTGTRTNNNVNVLDLEKKELTKKTTELYPKKDIVKEKPRFKATPVISPVYGILDKNYKKEEVKEKLEEANEMKRPSKTVDFETVRRKAFGNLTDDIKDNMMCENCELYKEVKRISSLKEDDLLYDMTVDDSKVTLEKAYDNYEEFGVAYEPKKEEEEVIINNNVDDSKEVEAEAIEFKEVEEEKVPSREEKKKETKVDADFFELIDSMYKERNDE